MLLSDTEIKICFTLIEKPMSLYEIRRSLNEKQKKTPKCLTCKHIKKGVCTDKLSIYRGKKTSYRNCQSCRRFILREYSDSHIYNFIGTPKSKNRLIETGAVKQNGTKYLLHDGCFQGLLIHKPTHLVMMCPNSDYCLNKDVNNGCMYSDLLPTLRI